MASLQQLESWVESMRILRRHRDQLRSPDLELLEAYERELAKLEEEEKAAAAAEVGDNDRQKK